MALNNTEDFFHLRWLCRRGMLELDLLLMQFMDKHFLGLTSMEQEIFKELLSSNDQDLFAWLFRNKPSPNPQFEPLLQKIRKYTPYT